MDGLGLGRNGILRKADLLGIRIDPLQTATVSNLRKILDWKGVVLDLGKSGCGAGRLRLAGRKTLCCYRCLQFGGRCSHNRLRHCRRCCGETFQWLL